MKNYKIIPLYKQIGILCVLFVFAACDACKKSNPDRDNGKNQAFITEEMITAAKASYTPVLADVLLKLKNDPAGVDVNSEVSVDKYANGILSKTRILHIATELGNVDIVRALLARGADVNLLDGDQYAPLHIAARGGHLAVVKVLLSTPGIDINKKGNWDQTPLFLAAEWNKVDVVKELLACPNIDVNARDRENLTALRIAKNQEIIQLLKAKGGSA